MKKVKKITSFVTLLALSLSSFAVSVPQAEACGAVCPQGDVKYEIGGGYEYTDDSATISGDGNTVYWSAAQGCTVTNVCIKIGGQGGGSLITPDPSLGQWTTCTHDISHVVVSTNCQPTPVCGDGECNGDETCSTCPGDCGTCPPSCITEGNSGAVIPDGPDCCEGLTKIGCSGPDQSGNCPTEPCVGAFYCTMCGNGICGPGENKCNCPEDCEEPTPVATISAYKIACQSESDLPNWGNGGSDITSTTAQDFVNGNQNCQLTSGWKFEWAYAGTANPGDNIIGPAGGAWTTFGPTESNGLAVTNISSLSGDRIWVREVMQEGYIPFSGDTSAPRDNVSAEIYCYKDVLNYDNYDYIINPVLGETYYCVAFNAPEEEITTYSLTASTTGFGWVTSTPAGINCGYEASDCTEDYEEGTDVTLTATPGSGQKFDGWAGNCSGTSTVCVLTMDGTKSVTAAFSLIPGVITHTVTFDGNGGTPTSTQIVVLDGATVETLPTITRAGYNFVGWNTQSNGSGNTFTTSTVVTADITVYAIWQEIVGPIRGCTDPLATNYNSNATENDGSCIYPVGPIYGCTDSSAINYNSSATQNDGSCAYRSRSGGYYRPSQGQVLGEEVAAECGLYLLEYIEYGANNNPFEVKKLQIFLNQHMGSNLPITGVYDLATMQVLNQFQVQYKEQVLRPWVDDAGTHCDVNEPTGYVYKTTQRWINLIMCPTLNLPMPDLSAYPKADCSAYWGAVLGEEVTAEEDGALEEVTDESEESMAEGEETAPEEMPFEIEEETPAGERDNSIIWLVIIVVLLAAAAIWFVWKGIKK